MRKFMLLSLVLLLSLATPLISDEVATETEDDVTLEQVDKKIDKIYDTQQIMYKETKNSPLEDKKYGIEVNLFRLLLIDDNSFSGTFSLFDVNRQAEIAFPVYYFNPDYEYGTKIFTLDCHYRHFLRNTQNGFYLSAFTRFANFSGYQEIYSDDWESDDYYKEKTITDIGIGVGLGYRIFSYRGIYWGTSISFGRYLLGNNLSDLEFDNNDLFIPADKQIINIEFLKFGWAF